jgi:hypothetical protein
MALEGEEGMGEEEEEADAETKVQLMTEWLERRQAARAAAAAAAEQEPSVVQPTPEVTRTITPTKRQGPSLVRRLHPVSPNTSQGNASAMQKVLAELDAIKSSTPPPPKPQVLVQLDAAYATSPPESPQKKARMELDAAEAAPPASDSASTKVPTEPHTAKAAPPPTAKTAALKVSWPGTS